MVQLFIDGGGFMSPIQVIFIIGLVFVLERLYHFLDLIINKAHKLK